MGEDLQEVTKDVQHKRHKKAPFAEKYVHFLSTPFAVDQTLWNGLKWMCVGRESVR